MERVLHNPVRPLVAVIGGAKVSSKIGVLEHLLPRVDALVIGGGMACTFLKAQGYDVGRSLLEEDRVAFAGELIQRAKERGGRLLLPVDGLYVDRIDDPTFKSLAQVSAIPPGSMMVDIGPQSVAAFRRALSEARTTLWNGPMGIFERPDYAEGTRAIAEAIAGSGATTVAGGGDTVAAIELFSDASRFTHVSTGGGATLELLEGRVLPGVAALLDRP
jgi:phosphoglycerate kinase